MLNDITSVTACEGCSFGACSTLGLKNADILECIFQINRVSFSCFDVVQGESKKKKPLKIIFELYLTTLLNPCENANTYRKKASTSYT